MLTGFTIATAFYENLTSLILKADFEAVQQKLLDIPHEGLAELGLDAARLQYFEVVNYLLQNHLAALKAKIGDILPWATASANWKGMQVVETLVREACSFIPESKLAVILFYLEGHGNLPTLKDLIQQVGAVSFTAEQLNVALELAVKHGEDALVTLILSCMKEGHNPKTRAFEFAIDHDHRTVLELLVQSNHWGKKERAAAYKYAAKKGLIEMVEVFVESSLGKKHHIKAMKKAVQHGHLEVASMIAQRKGISPDQIEQMISNINRKLRSLVVLQDRLNLASREKLVKKEKRKPTSTQDKHTDEPAVATTSSTKHVADALAMLRGETAFNRSCLNNGLKAAIEIDANENPNDIYVLIRAVPWVQACHSELLDPHEVVFTEQDMSDLLFFALNKPNEEKIPIYRGIIGLICFDVFDNVDAGIWYYFINELMQSKPHLAFKILDKTLQEIPLVHLTAILKQAVAHRNIQIVSYLIEHRGYISRHWGDKDPIADCIRISLLASDMQMFYTIVHHRSCAEDSIKRAFKDAAANGELVVVSALYNTTLVCKNPNLINRALNFSAKSLTSEMVEFLESILEHRKQVQNRSNAQLKSRESLDLQSVDDLTNSLESMGVSSDVEEDPFVPMYHEVITPAFDLEERGPYFDTTGKEVEQKSRKSFTASK